MARKSPLSKLQETVVGTVKGAITHPVESAEKAVEQAKGTLSLGKMVAGQVTKGAAGVVASRLPGHRADAPSAKAGSPLVPVPAPAPERTADQTAEETAAAKSAPRPAPPAAKKAPAKKATAKKTPATKTPTPTKPPVTDLATEAVKKQAAQQPVKKSTPAPVSRIDAAADTAHVDATPADLAKKTTTAKKATAKKATAKKAPTKASAAKAAPAKKTADSTPGGRLPARKRARSAAEVLEDTSVPTPVGTTGADVATNPDTTDTDLQQPGTEPIMDSATTKAVASDAATGARGASTDKG